MTTRLGALRRRCGASVAVVTVVTALLALSPASAAADDGDMRIPPPGPSQGQQTAVDAREQKFVALRQYAIEAQAVSEQASKRVALLEDHVTRLTAQADQTALVAGRLYEELGDSPVGGVVSSISSLLGGDDAVAAAEAAAEAAGHAQELAAIAQGGLIDARVEAATALHARKTAKAEAVEAGVKAAARLAAEEASRHAEFGRGYRVDDPTQDRRNRQALKRWQAYLASLAEAGVVPPNATALEVPRKLAGRFRSVRDRKAVVSPEASAPVVVLSAETIRAVSEAFSRVGLRNAGGPGAYACGGLTRQAWAATKIRIPGDSVAQWESLATVPTAQMQPGDLVFVGDEALSVRQIGVYLGDRQMITADPDDGEVGVRLIAEKRIYGVKRVPLPAANSTLAPPADGVPTGCGEIGEPRPADKESLWTHPLAEGSYSLSAAFGAAGPLWSSGEHSGQDFAAPLDTPVYATRDGVVTVEAPDWAGNLVRIDHGGGVETRYAHLSRVVVKDGERVRAGAVVGAVGDEGNSTGPHLHFEMLLDGVAIDPMLILEADVPSAWGGFANGEIPASELCAASSDGHLLRCDAAVGYRLLDAAYAEQMGTALCITDSYRSREGQEQLFRTKPMLAAVPGTSNHGLGLAVDLCGGVEGFDTPEHAWLLANGPTFGWHHPHWAAVAGSRPEPWHFEFAA